MSSGMARVAILSEIRNKTLSRRLIIQKVKLRARYSINDKPAQTTKTSNSENIYHFFLIFNLKNVHKKVFLHRS
jgi:hypothetical protein